MIDPSLATDISAIASLQGEFRLRSGQVSTTYFDKYRFESDPDLLRRLAKVMTALLPSKTQVLAGLELGGVPIATAISLTTGIPAVFVRKAAKTYGTCQAVEGGDVHSRRIVLIEDVITTGGAVVDAIRLVEQAGGQVVGVVCAIWRGEGAARLDAYPAMPVAAALTKDDLMAPA